MLLARYNSLILFPGSQLRILCGPGKLHNHSDCVIKKVAEYLLMVLSYSFGSKYLKSSTPYLS
jgi:hypothetical protein